MASGASGARRLKIQEVDGSPSGYPNTLKVSNGNLTDNADGTFTLSVTPADASITRAKLAAGVGVWREYSQPGADNAAAATDNFAAAPATTRFRNMRDNGATSLAAEATAQRRILHPCTLYGVKGRMTAQTGDSNLVITVRKNGADTLMTVTRAAAAGAGVFTLAGGPIDFVEGDLVCLSLVSGAGSTFSGTISEVESLWRDT